MPDAPFHHKHAVREFLMGVLVFAEKEPVAERAGPKTAFFSEDRRARRQLMIAHKRGM